MSREHLLGCDLYGRDVLSLLIYGCRTSLLIACSVVLLTASVGTVIGILAGYFGGILDLLLMAVLEVTMSFPGILLALTVAAFLGPGMLNIILAISLTGWTGFARLVRGQVLSLKEREYVLCGKSLGASSFYLMRRYILPELSGVLFVFMSFSLSGVILTESSLSFLGLSAQNHPSWGELINQGRQALSESPLLSIAPGFAIFMTVISLNILGDEFT